MYCTMCKNSAAIYTKLNRQVQTVCLPNNENNENLKFLYKYMYDHKVYTNCSYINIYKNYKLIRIIDINNFLNTLNH